MCSRLLCSILLLLGASAPLHAQLDLGGAPLPGGEEHWYVRSRALLDSAAADPWAARRTSPLPRHGLHLRVLRPDLRVFYHSLRPNDEDGVIWAGRGATGAVQGGIEARWGLVHLQIAPIAFHAQNRPFPLIGNGRTDRLRFGDARFPGNIDLPQRFGDGAYSRIDPGESFATLEWGGVTAGISSARQLWGPAREYPLVLGTRAGGFPHAFLGTLRPLDLWIGAVEGRWIVGRLEQSDWSPVQSGERRRLHTGLSLSFRPHLLPWLEVGGNRTETSPWPKGGPTLTEALGPFEGVFNPGGVQVINSSPSNGYASIFTRIAGLGSGLELYGELTYEDFVNDPRRFLQKLDDLSVLTLGVGRSWSDGRGRLQWLGLEMTNGQLSHVERGQRGFVGPFPPYVHSGTAQGLTNHGQVLGSLATYLGSGSVLNYDRYDARGRVGVRLRRQLLVEGSDAAGTQVLLAGQVAVTRFVGTAEWGAEVGPTYLSRRSPADPRAAYGISALLRWRGF